VGKHNIWILQWNSNDNFCLWSFGLLDRKRRTVKKIKQMRIDFSGLSAWRDCPYYFMKYYQEGCRAVPDGGPDPASDGSKIHTGLQQYYLGQQVQPTGDPKLDVIITSYIRRYPIETDHFEVVDVERSLDVRINDWLTLAMTIDLMAVDKYTKEPMIIDHKTTKWMSYLPNKIYSLQFDTYMYGCHTIGFEAYSGLINGISTDPNARVPFKRLTVSRSSYHLQRWKEQMEADCQRIKDTIEKGLPVTQALRESCAKKYGKPCFLLSVCTATSADLAESYLETYHNDTWKNFSIEYK
jgi:hypothetical protein